MRRFIIAVLAGVLGLPGVSSAQSVLPRFETVEEGAPFPVDVNGPRYQRG